MEQKERRRIDEEFEKKLNTELGKVVCTGIAIGAVAGVAVGAVIGAAAFNKYETKWIAGLPKTRTWVMRDADKVAISMVPIKPNPSENFVKKMRSSKFYCKTGFHPHTAYQYASAIMHAANEIANEEAT